MSKKKHFKSNRLGNDKSQERIQSQIYRYFLNHHDQTVHLDHMINSLRLRKPNEREMVVKAMVVLQAEHKIDLVEPNAYRLNFKPEDLLEGIVEIQASGSGYLVVEDVEEDCYVYSKHMINALHKDKVLALKTIRKGKSEAYVLKVLERANTQFIGVYHRKSTEKYGFVVVDKSKIHVDFYIDEMDSMGAQHGHKVVIELKNWPPYATSPSGTIVNILGDSGEHQTEMHAILAEYGLPAEFPAELETLAESLSDGITPQEVSKRRDMRSILTFTIDPADAKDFDDALSFEDLGNGLYEIGVHIADVSHYIVPGTALDDEAYARATSVYLVDRVVPMLPERLSNGVCSLRPHEDKLTFSAVFQMDENAKIHAQWFGRTLIHSDQRFSYEQAQEIIELGEGTHAKELALMNKMAKIMREKRLNDGAISFDKLEVKFNLDESANPVGVYFKHSRDANKLIEEFMLLANRKVSEFVSLNADGTASKNTFVYRIHDDPDPDKLLSLKQFVKPFGYDLDLANPKAVAQSINRLLMDVKGKGEENMIETLAMRCMSKAVYSTDPIGHYGLGFEYYSHFTSPIRRYPDVMAHRLLQHYLDGGQSPAQLTYETMCKHCSQREKLATDAERDSIKYMQAKYMEQHLGETFDGVISGVTEWGIYVEILENLCEGMISLRNMVDDHYVYDSQKHSVTGQKSKNTLRLGDTIQIKVESVDALKKQLNFSLV